MQVLRVLLTLVISLHFFLGCSDDNNPQAPIEDITQAINTDETDNGANTNKDSPTTGTATKDHPRFDTIILEDQIESQIIAAKKEFEALNQSKAIEKENLLTQLEKAQQILNQKNKEYDSLQQSLSNFNEKFTAISQKYQEFNDIRSFKISEMEPFKENGQEQFHQFFSGLQDHYRNLIDTQNTNIQGAHHMHSTPNEEDIARLAELGFHELKAELKELQNQFFMSLNLKLKQIGINLYEKSEHRIAELEKEIAKVEDFFSKEEKTIIDVGTKGKEDPTQASHFDNLQTLITNIEMATDQQKSMNVYLINNPPQYSLERLTSTNPWENLGTPFTFELNWVPIFSLEASVYLSGKHEILDTIALAYEQWRQEQESAEELHNELRTQAHALLVSHELTPTGEKLDDHMTQLSEYQNTSLAQLDNQEQLISQQKVELEVIHTSIENLDITVKANLEMFKKFEEQVYASPEYRKIVLSKNIEKDGIDAHFSDVIDFIIQQHLSKLSLSEDEKELAKASLNALADESVGVEIEEFKWHYEGLMIEKFNEEKDLFYNVQSDNLFHPILDGRIQDVSGTLLFNTLKWKSDQSLDNIVIIFTEGHVLPGFLTKDGESYYLTGVETVTPGISLKHFGPTTEVSGDLRVYDAKWAITLYLLGEKISNVSEVVDDMVSQMEVYGFKKGNLLSPNSNLLSEPSDGSVQVNRFSPLAFGQPQHEEGDLERDSFNPLDVTQFTKSNHLVAE